MEIYCEGCSGSRFGIEAKDFSSAPAEELRAPHLILYHVEENDTVSAAERVRKSLPGILKNPGASVLCFKGTMLAGLAGPEGREIIRTFREEYAGRVHFLSFAVLGGTSFDVGNRFRDFAERVRDSASVVDWSIIDPQWSDNLLAVYLAMRALAAAGEDSPLAQMLGDCPAFDRIVSEAEREYRLLKGPGASLGPLGPGMADYVASDIWQVFESRRV
jgi:hypothetical protein